MPLLRAATDQTARGRRTREAAFVLYLCEALLAEGETVEARPLAERALARDELGMRPIAARCHLDPGPLCRRIGDARRAESGLAPAIAMLREMDMRHWLVDAESHAAKELR
jgi:hypothetical protein